jgi:hypothetical protein
MGNTQRSECVDQESQIADAAAINTSRCRFPAGGRSKAAYTYAPCPRIAGGTDSNPDSRGRGDGMERRSTFVCSWSGNGVVWPLLRAATCRDRSSISGEDPWCRELGRLMPWWKAERLPRSGRPILKRRPSCFRPDQPVCSECEAAALQ